MPPRIPVKFPWPSRTATAKLNGADIPLCARTFSSTPAALALGPQSPNYIEVPKPAQPTFPLAPTVKGHLPVPRDIFKTRSKLPKQSDPFIERTTRTPKATKVPGPHSRDADYRLYKQRLADSRRDALQQGIKQLHERKVTTEREHMARIRANYADRRKRAMAPPRQVDVLTQTSIDKGIRDYLSNQLPATARGKVTQAMRDRYARRVRKIEAVRASRLHDLYVNAREFIVEEEQLDEAIDKVFGTEENPMGWDTKGNMGPRAQGKDGLSPWHGPVPEGVSEMMQGIGRAHF